LALVLGLSALVHPGRPLYAAPGATTPWTNHLHLADFAILGKLNYSADNEPNDGLGESFGVGSTISRIWIEHTKVGMWPVNSSGVLIQDCRIRNTIADAKLSHASIRHLNLPNFGLGTPGRHGLRARNDAHGNLTVSDSTVVEHKTDSRCIPLSRKTHPCFGKESGHCASKLVQADRFIQDGVNRVVGPWLFPVPGYHEDRLPGRQPLDSGCKFIALHERDFKVGHHQVELTFGKQRKSLGPVVGLDHRMFVHGQQLSDAFPVEGLILDKQYALLNNLILLHRALNVHRFDERLTRQPEPGQPPFPPGE
jgi:hypothetical protein